MNTTNYLLPELWRIILVEYATMELKYEREGDKNGLLYLLGTRFHTQKWENPAGHPSAGHLEISCSNNDLTIHSCGSHILGQHSSVARGDLRTKNVPNTTIVFTFPTVRLQPTAYTLQTGDLYLQLRNWQFEASDDGIVWDILKRHTNDASFVFTCQFVTWELTTTKFYHLFRIVQTGKGDRRFIPDFAFVLRSFEIYGNICSR